LTKAGEKKAEGLLLVAGRLGHQLVDQELVLEAREAKLGTTSALLQEGGFMIMTFNLLY
jgi:hypothetical protein